ncbi:DNA-directed RNA polymerase delta subunit [Candidatus Phytoplasma oryzae]|uniref:RNAP delta factor n=1 Tax=Candidatus Phytoplasma oryzae TaxID=203274 RepID=A0A139JQY7_9MOLU|nr:DNA-directed RNA polymerase subunit delta [Candidatus Phytoplasma oryzae]KXT29286.1 DNA-directed RNA polymerase delta subunit [Candidatus Phytoplasma oryzae]RAM57678.1 hypothetical protein DH96_02175 [Candidatus Phytoplasma oryzae]
MKKNEKYNLEKSMLDIASEILQKNKKPISIYKLIEKVFKIKKINTQKKEKFSQLYLDIVLSGNFVFHGNNLWSTKEDFLNLWDQEHFHNIPDENNDNIKKEEIEKKIFNFDDFILNKNESEENDSEETEIDASISEENFYLDIDDKNILENDEKEKNDDIDDI